MTFDALPEGLGKIEDGQFKIELEAELQTKIAFTDINGSDNAN